MTPRHPSQEVQSLFGPLEAVQKAMAETTQAFLDALDDKYASSGLAELQAQVQILDKEATRIEREIREHVEGSCALMVFARQIEAMQEPAPVSGFVGMRTTDGGERTSDAFAEEQKQRPPRGLRDLDVPL